MPACFRCEYLEEDIASLMNIYPSIADDITKLEKLLGEDEARGRRCYEFSPPERVYCIPVTVDLPVSGPQRDRCTLVYERIDGMSCQLWYLFNNDLPQSEQDIAEKVRIRRGDQE